MSGINEINIIEAKVLYKQGDPAYITVKLRPNNIPAPGKIFRCPNDGIPVLEYFGMEIVFIFEGKMVEAVMGFDALCSRCSTKYRFIV
jgi:hypothetical protein